MTDSAITERILEAKGHETYAYGQGSYDGDACRQCPWQGPQQSGKGHTETTRREMVRSTLAHFANAASDEKRDLAGVDLVYACGVVDTLHCLAHGGASHSSVLDRIVKRI